MQSIEPGELNKVHSKSKKNCYLGLLRVTGSRGGGVVGNYHAQKPRKKAVES